jgi:ankyrin repeat protein
MNGHERVVKLLINSGGIDVNIKNNYGVTALHYGLLKIK